MSNIEKIEKELLKKPEKKPANPTKLAIVFADLIFLLLDVGSGIGVWYVTGVLFYGILVTAVGIIPLLLWQIFYSSPYANDSQKKTAGWGVGISIASVGILAIAVSVTRFLSDAAGAEIALAVLLVVLAITHAILGAYYYQIDEEIQARQNERRATANAERKIRMGEIARKVIESNVRALAEREKLEKEFSPKAVAAAMGEDAPDPTDGRN